MHYRTLDKCYGYDCNRVRNRFRGPTPKDMVTRGCARLLAHFLPKFDNLHESARLVSEPGCETATCLIVSKKHSGSLVMAPPFYSKNGCANQFSRMGALLLREHFNSVWQMEAEQQFAEWWAHAEEHGLCYSFECVVPRILGDHGATPHAAYLVLMCVAHVGGGGFLLPEELLRLATRWRLPLNQAWYVPWHKAAEVEDALHAGRWTMSDSDADGLLEGRGTRQCFLRHVDTQGEVLEGFVLMAIEATLTALDPLLAACVVWSQPCASHAGHPTPSKPHATAPQDQLEAKHSVFARMACGSCPLVPRCHRRYEAAMAPHRDAALARAREIACACTSPEAQLMRSLSIAGEVRRAHPP